MAVVVESGVGVRGANAYVDAAFVTAYLAARNRSKENGWNAASGGAKDAAVVAATDYVEVRWGPKFKGARLVWLADVKAEGSITFTGVPAAGGTVVVGDRTYALVAALTDVPDQVLLGATAEETAEHLLDALEALAIGAGVTYVAGNDGANRHAQATRDGAVLELVATAPGAGGDETALALTATNATRVAFAGGLDGGSQPLSFPRSGLYDSSGRLVEGVPLPLRQATAEYAVRALAAALAPDPTDDAAGGSIRSLREKVGPIEVETEYVDGTHLGTTLQPYPAADRLLEEYVKGGVGAYGYREVIR